MAGGNMHPGYPGHEIQFSDMDHDSVRIICSCGREFIEDNYDRALAAYGIHAMDMEERRDSL